MWEGFFVPLTSLAAKATHETLLVIFVRTEVPNTIASDNGMNFNAHLTQEFEWKMGANLSLSKPLYLQSNELIEKFSKILKGMLHHEIKQEPWN